MRGCYGARPCTRACDRTAQPPIGACQHPPVAFVTSSGAIMCLWSWRWRTRAAWSWQPTIPTARPGSRAWSRALCRTSPPAIRPPAGKTWGTGTGAMSWHSAGVSGGFCWLYASQRVLPYHLPTSWALCSLTFLASTGKVIQRSAAGQDWERETWVLILNLVNQQLGLVSCPRYSTRQSPGKKKKKHMNQTSAQVI